MSKKAPVQYPKGHWTKVIGGYKGSLQLPVKDQARRPVESSIFKPTKKEK